MEPFDFPLQISADYFCPALCGSFFFFLNRPWVSWKPLHKLTVFFIIIKSFGPNWAHQWEQCHPLQTYATYAACTPTQSKGRKNTDHPLAADTEWHKVSLFCSWLYNDFCEFHLLVVSVETVRFGPWHIPTSKQQFESKIAKADMVQIPLIILKNKK